MDTSRFLFQQNPPLLRKFFAPRVTPGQSLLLRESTGVSGPMISVVIPAHNEERYIGLTLEALQRQDYGRFEVIVVANGCTDNTARLARGKCDRLVVLSQKGLGPARNFGARVALGDVLAFLDADTLLEPTALRTIARRFLRQDAAATLMGRPDSPRFRYRAIYCLKNAVHRWGLHGGSSGVIICWKEAFDRSGGFDEKLEVRENSELIRRLKQWGNYRYIGDAAATTSMRRYEQRGFQRVVWLWVRLWFESLFKDLRFRHYDAVR